MKTFHPCFDVNQYPPFPSVVREIRYNSNVYFISTDLCPEGCNGEGLCTLGRCTCKNGKHGIACNLINCPNSLVFVDIDILDPQHCYHCAQNGICYNGTCKCSESFIGKDCSQTWCLNNCSNTPTSTPVGDCIMDFPKGFCQCYEWEKRGGDDCSYKFCLNECS